MNLRKECMKTPPTIDNYKLLIRNLRKEQYEELSIPTADCNIKITKKGKPIQICITPESNNSKK